MKRSSAELKRMARERLLGHYGIPLSTLLVTALITTAATLPFHLLLDTENSLTDMIMYQIAYFIITLVSVIFSAGIVRIHLKLARGKAPAFSDMFSCFTSRPDRFILTGLISGLITVAAILPCGVCMALGKMTGNPMFTYLAIPLLLVGIALVTAIELVIALVVTLLAEQDSMGVMEAFRTSARLMSGHKGRLLYINLSFLGMTMLALLSFGIGYLWVGPYISQTNALFYLDVTGELDR